MDAHLLTKIIHMSAVSLLIIAFVFRAATLFVGVQDQQPNPKGFKALVGLQHLSLTLIIVTGAILVVMKNFEVAPWFYAKVILFFVLWSSLIKISLYTTNFTEPLSYQASAFLKLPEFP